MDLLTPAAFSAAVATSQVISTKIPLTVLGTNALRTAVLGVACAAWLFLSKDAPSLGALPAWVPALSVTSGALMFGATLVYISMCRDIGVVATSVSTTAFSFVFTAMAGLWMGEVLTWRTFASMAAIVAAIVIHKGGPGRPP